MQSEKYSEYGLQLTNKDEINLIDIAIIFAKHKELILTMPIIVMVIVVLIGGLSSKKTAFEYNATIKMFFTESSTPKEAIFSLINSSSMVDSLANRVDLVKMYNATEMNAKNILIKKINARIDNNYITVTISDSDSSRAAKILRVFPKVTDNIIKNFAITESSKRRIIFEKSLSDVKQDYENAERQFIEAQNKGLSVPESKVLEMYKEAASLKSRIAMKELELFTIMSQDISKYPSYLKLERDLDELWDEYSNIDNSPKVLNKVSSDQLRYIHLFVDYKYKETKYDQLLKMIQKAKSEEMYDYPIIRVIYSVETSINKKGTNILTYVIFSGVLSFIIVLLLVLFIEAYRSAKNDQKNLGQFKALKEAMKWRNR